MVRGLVVLILICVGLFASSVAGAQQQSGVAAIVQTDGAQVYTQPDFDADVIATLPAGQKIRVSKGVTGQMAKFHKVKVGNRYGYIVDIDVVTEGAAKKKRAGAKAPAKAKHDRPRKDLPVFFSRYVGVLVGQSEFKEDIPGVDASTNLLTYGLKIVGPDVILSGPIIDFNLALHYGAPSYYDKLSSVKPAGYLVFTDMLLLMPFYQAHNTAGLLGAGPLGVLSSFRVVSANKAQDLTTFNVGLSLMAGFAFRFGPVGLRLEGKYLIEKQSYKVVQAAILSEF